MGINLSHLETFAVLGRELNFRRTAEIMYVSQPAVSQQMNKLEEQLGYPILERSSSGVRLTPAGADLHRVTKETLGVLRDVIGRSRAEQNGRVPTLTIGYISTWARTEIPRLAVLIENELPAVDVVLESFVVDELLKALRARQIDLALFHLPDVMELDTTLLQLSRVGSTQRSIAVPKAHSLATRSSVAIEELSDVSWVAATGLYAENFTALCRQHGFVPKVAFTAANPETMLGLVRAGLGVTVVPNRPPGWDDLAFIPIDDELLDIVVAQRLDALTPSAPKLIALIRTVFTPGGETA